MGFDEAFQVVDAGFFPDIGAVMVDGVFREVHQLGDLLGAESEEAEHTQSIFLFAQCGVSFHYVASGFGIGGVELGENALEGVVFPVVVDLVHPLEQVLAYSVCDAQVVRLQALMLLMQVQCLYFLVFPITVDEQPGQQQGDDKHCNQQIEFQSVGLMLVLKALKFQLAVVFVFPWSLGRPISLSAIKAALASSPIPL